jgi:uncharacterized protein DUF6624
MNDSLRQELLNMREEDLRVRAEILAEANPLPYDPRMQEVHQRNAMRLREMVTEHGWPIERIVGKDGAEAAWLILQHAIGHPALQRGYLAVLQAAAQAGEIPAWQPAYLFDRIRYFEGRPQVYGTHWATIDDGTTKLWLTEDAEHVNERRLALGLDPIAIDENPMTSDEALAIYNNPDFVEWARQVGWL